MENAAIERLQTRIKQTRLQNSKVQLQHHLEETRQQVRLKQLISGLGGKATRDKGRLPVPSSSKSIENLIKKHRTSAEAELKGAKEDAIVESAEIILHDMLIQLAQKAATVGGGDAIPVLTQNLDEEKGYVELDQSKYSSSYHTTLAKYYSLCSWDRRRRNNFCRAWDLNSDSNSI
jgi:ferritin-like metal-binding protein YciE